MAKCPPTKARIGTAAWSVPRVLAERFPGAGSHLERYAGVLNCAEINSSFYRPPMAGTWRRWAASVPAGFQFSVKAPRTITHDHGLAGPAELLTEFLAGCCLLGPALGPILLQLPPKLAFAQDVAAAFLTELRRQYDGPVVLEPRHATWFTAEVSALLTKFRAARVAADPARVAEAAEPGGWSGFRYYRLHGSPRIYYSAYEPEYLEGLAAQVTDATWVIFDNTASGAAAGDALRLRALC